MPTHHHKATLFRAKGPEQSGFMMDAVTKIQLLPEYCG